MNEASTSLLAIDPGHDLGALHAVYSRSGRLQIRNFLRPAAADGLFDLLRTKTPWGLAWCGAGDGPHSRRAHELSQVSAAERQQIGSQVQQAAAAGRFAFLYAHYPMLDAYLGKWQPGGPHDDMLEQINAEPMLSFVRAVTGVDGLVKADAQATLYGPSHFLTVHDDSHAQEGRRVAYVLSMAREWKPDWGGQLQFHGGDDNIEVGYLPGYNTLSLFAVPQRHSVAYVPPFAPIGRFAITGWFRDR